MDHDSQTVLVLLALRQLGGQSVPAKQDLFTKGLKNELQTAIEKELVKAEKITVETTDAEGKVKKSKLDVLHLTPAGDEALKQAANPEALAATRAAEIEHSKKQHAAEIEHAKKQHAAEIEHSKKQHHGTLTAEREESKKQHDARVAAELTAWKTRIYEDRKNLLATLKVAAKAANAPPAVSDKDYATLAKAVHDLVGKLEKIEKQLEKNDRETILAKIDEGFERLLAMGGEFTAPAESPAAEPSSPAMEEAAPEVVAPHAAPATHEAAHAVATPHASPAEHHETAPHREPAEYPPV